MHQQFHFSIAQVNYEKDTHLGLNESGSSLATVVLTISPFSEGLHR